MRIADIAGATRRLGEAQGYLPLPIRDEEILFENGSQIEAANRMTSEWVPDELERKAIAAGGSIFLSIIGNGHPPVRIYVADERCPHTKEMFE